MITLEQFSQLTHAQYTQAHNTLIITGTFKACGISVEVAESEDSSIDCLKQSGIAADSVSCIFQLTAEILAARDDDDDDPILSSDDDEDELETSELIVEDTD